jgi:hypothetical protein
LEASHSQESWFSESLGEQAAAVLVILSSQDDWMYHAAVAFMFKRLFTEQLAAHRRGQCYQTQGSLPGIAL